MLERPPGRHLIYGLLDPRTGTLRYIGKTHKRRELGLAEHIDAAEENRGAPVYDWIRELLNLGEKPVIFVLKKIPGTGCWEEAERIEIKYWKEFSKEELPYVHPPQTRKSLDVLIENVDLLNVRPGGR